MNTRARKTEIAPSSVRTGRYGPSRVDNARQRRIAELIDGYESTVTLSAVTRNVLLAWLIPAAGMIVLGIETYRGQGARLSEDQLVRLLASTHFASALLLVASIAVLLMWTMRSWLNLAKIGPKPALSIWPKLRLHLPAFAFGVIGTLLRSVLGAESVVAQVMMVIGLVGGLAIVPILLIDTYRAIWQRSTSPKSGSIEMPTRTIVLVFSLVIAVSIVVLNKIFGDGAISISGDIAWFMTVGEGLTVGCAGWTAATLVNEIGRRQDTRLVYIVESSREEKAGSQIVTDSDLDSAWEASEGLLEFEY